MTWLQMQVLSHWQWLTLNAAALGVFVYVLTHGNAELSGTTAGLDSMLAMGEWGVRWLLVSLAMTPLYTYLHWRGALKLRKSAGLWAFAFGAAHLVIFVRDPQAATELSVYLGILAVLLIVRVPQVRARLLKLTANAPIGCAAHCDASGAAPAISNFARIAHFEPARVSCR